MFDENVFWGSRVHRFGMLCRGVTKKKQASGLRTHGTLVDHFLLSTSKEASQMIVSRANQIW